jgi:outer membrane protein assembly factor BamC
MKHYIYLVLMCMAVTSCSWLGIEDRSGDYLLSEETQVTVVPESMDGSKLGEIYQIPKLSDDVVPNATPEVPRPQPISVNAFEQLVKIQRIDSKRWILINNSPSELWPRVRNILNRNGIPTATADGSGGVIETIWLDYSSDPENKHRFRFSISPGVQLNSTEITILHQHKPADIDTVSQWPQLSHLDAKEKDMITFLANQLAAQPDYASVSLLARDIGGVSKVEVINPDIADPYILVKLSYDRTWASVNYSASRGGFTLIDHDSAQGLLVVNYSDELLEEKSSGISSWFGGKDNDDIIQANYRILVQEVEASVEVRVVSFDGDSLEKEQALKLLNIFRSNMS